MSSTKDIMPATQMANAGDLGKLPPEIRKEIYTYLLVEPNIIAIKRFLRAKSKHKYDTVAHRLRNNQAGVALTVTHVGLQEPAYGPRLRLDMIEASGE